MYSEQLGFRFIYLDQGRYNEVTLINAVSREVSCISLSVFVSMG